MIIVCVRALRLPPDRRFTGDWEVDRIGNEAFFMRVMMQRRGFFRIAIGRDSDFGPESDAREIAAPRGVFDHRPFSMIDVADDIDAGDGAEMQVPELVAG